MDGEGVVAIVQGLRDAGVAVTVLNRRLLRTRNSHRRPVASKSSVETNTDKSYSDYYKISKGTNVRDGHYSSIYQIAHCNARPTSPPQSSLEFPPQRLKPSRTEGNFEVGGSYGVRDTSTSPSQVHGSHIGYFDRSVDTGSMYMNRSERKSHETFAHSLRRYPYSPERSISSELVQKLLSYTQNKYQTKSTSKSQRSLNRERSPQSSILNVKQSKHIQTYTRTKREHRTRDFGANTCHDFKFMNRNRKSNSTLKSNSYKDGKNTRYDYLDSPPTTSRHSPYRSEVRYIRDVKKYIRDTISQIYDDRQMVCPKIKSRYSQHRRRYHRDQPGCQSVEVQASVPTTSKTACTHFCHPPPGSHSYSHNIANASTSDITCCTCKKPKPCVCQLKAEMAAAVAQQHITDWIDELPLYTEDTRANKREKEKLIKELLDIISKTPKDENYNEVIKEEITNFIENLPIWDAGDAEDSEGQKNGIVDGLIDRLQTVEDQILAAVRDIVRKWLDGIPLDIDMDMNKTAQYFASQLTPLLKNVGQLKTKLKELLKHLPITNKDDVIDEIHDDFANDLIELSPRGDQPVLTEEEMENEINEYLESDPDNKIVDQGDKVKNLARKLKNTQSELISESDKEEKMKDNVVHWIDTLPKSTKEKFPPKEKEEFTDDLVDKIQYATNLKAGAKDNKSSLQTQNEIENEIWGLLESMDVDPTDVDESIVKGFAFNLNEMNKSDFDEQNVANKTIDFLNELDKSGVGMRSRDQDKFHKKVLEKLKKLKTKDRQSGGGRHSSFVTSTPRKGGTRPKKDFNVSSIGEGDESNYSVAGPSGLKNAEKQYNNELIDQIESWVKNLPINLDRRKSLINDLANDIMDRQKYLQIHPKAAKSSAEELEHLKYQVFRWLNKMDKLKDHEIAPVMDKTEILMDKIKNIDVPQFNKSGLRSPSKEKSFGSPNKEKRIRSPTRQQSLMSPAAEKNYSTPTREESLVSQTGKNIVVSPTKEKSILSPGTQKSYGSTSREISLGSPSREKTFGSPSREKGIGSPREQSLVSEAREKSRLPNREHNFMSVHSGDNVGSPAKERSQGSLSREKGLGSSSYIPTQNASMFIKENLDGVISDWIKQLPLYNKASPEQKRKFDKLISEISNGIKGVYDGVDNLDQDIDKLVKDEIVKQMNKFPISSEAKEDKKFMTQAAAQLLQNLKDQQMFQDISERTDVPYDEYLNQHVDDWVNSLSLTRLSSLEKIELEDLKHEFTSKLKKAREDKVDDETLKSEITKYLKKFPLKDTVKGNKEYQDIKAEELLKTLSTLAVAIASRKIPDIHHFVRQAIAKWMQKLPLDRGKTVNDIPKDAVENAVSKISDGLILSQEIPVKQVKKKVEDATVRFLDKTPLDPKKIRDTKELADDLFERVKDIPKSVMKGTPTFYVAGSSKEYSRDESVMKDTPTSYGSGSKEYPRDDEPISINELKLTVGDNLTGAILDYMIQQPDYLYKKAEYDKLASNVAENIKTTLKKSKGEDQDKDLIEAITKQLKNTPLELNAGDAPQLVQYLKDLQMLKRNSSKTTTQIDIEDLDDIINNFVNNNLNLQKVTWSEMKKFGELKSELSAKLKEMINDKAGRDALKKVLKYYLSRFPISEDDRRDDRYLDKKAEELVDSLPMDGSNNSPDVYSYVRKGFMKWMKNLPLEKGKNINDIPMQAVDQIVRRLSDLFIHTGVCGISDLKKNIKEETNKLLQISPIDENISYDPKKLAKDLFDCIKGSSQTKSKTSSIDKTTKGSTPKPLYMDKAADVSVPRSTGVFESEPRSSSKDLTTEVSIRKLSSKDKTTARSIPKSSSQDRAADVSVPRSTGVFVSEPRSSSKDTTTEASIRKSSPEDKTTKGSTPKPPYMDKAADVSVPRSTGVFVPEPRSSSKDTTTEASIWKSSPEDKTTARSTPKSTLQDRAADVSVPRSTGVFVSEPRSSSKDTTTEASIRKSSPEDKTTKGSTPKPPYMDKAADVSVPRSTGVFVSEPRSSSKDTTTEASIRKSSPEDKTTVRSTPKSTLQDRAADVSVPRSTGVFVSKPKLLSKATTTEASIPNSLLSEDKTTARSTPKSTLHDRTFEVSVPKSGKVSGPRPTSKTRNTESSIPSSEDETAAAARSTTSNKSNKSGSMHPTFKSSADQLADNIEQWVNNLPIKGDTPEEKSKASDLRRQLSSKIISKVSELNTNPEIFNDDFMYEEMFEDEVDKMITSLSNEDLKSKISPHKRNLIDIVIAGRRKTQEEMAGTVYKQQLRDVVAKNVPSKSLNKNENASLEVLKEDVADAFVSLHYIRGEKGDAETKAQFKNNVKSEVDKFCADYLKPHSKTAVDVENLNNDLYKALKDVPVPNDETMRHEIEIIKIKELINQWNNETKLLGNQTDVDRLKTKKMISVLAKKIHEIEKLKESNPDFDSNDMLKKEIVKWLQKMPLVVKNDLDELAEQLIKKLKETEDLRKSLRSDSSGKESTLPASSYSNGPWSLTMDSTGASSGNRFSSGSKPSSKNLRRSIVSATGDIPTVPEVSESTAPTTETTEKSTGPDYTIVPSPCAPPCAIPPSRLSPEDREYLKKIRERATQSGKQSSPRSSKDTAVSPIPVDYGRQTEITTDVITSTPQAESTHIEAQPSSETSEPDKTSKPEMQATGSQAEVVPNVIVKQYYWDSVNSKMSPCSNLTCPFTPSPKIPEVTCSSRSSNPCPYRTSQHAQTAPPSPQDCNPDSPYFLPNQPCKSKSRRSNKSCHNVGPKIRGSNRNLAWSKEDVYGERRMPSDEEEINIDTGRRRKVTCRCNDRVTVTNNGTTKRECRTCRTNDESLMRCPKCCGVHCPYPSYLYFKQ